MLPFENIWNVNNVLLNPLRNISPSLRMPTKMILSIKHRVEIIFRSPSHGMAISRSLKNWGSNFSLLSLISPPLFSIYHFLKKTQLFPWIKLSSAWLVSSRLKLRSAWLGFPWLGFASLRLAWLSLAQLGSAWLSLAQLGSA